VFQKNFFDDFKEELGKGHLIKKFPLCDFSDIREHLEREKLIKKAATLQEKAAKKELDNNLIYKHGFALVDGNLQKLGNFRMEPPGLFRGRGAHPKTGTVHA
jgi:DNA topoisomerase-1